MNNKGILDPTGKFNSPLTGLAYSNKYKEQTWWPELPVYKDAKKIIQLINDNQVLILISGTGSGKSVLVPFYALHTTNYQGKVVMTIPKRAAVVSAADTAALISNTTLGKEVGYQYRGARLPDGSPSKSADTKLLISTDGSIVAQLINDPSLKAYDIVIIDEAHERGIQIDLLLLLMKKALKLNPKLKLIIMSATIDPKIFSNYFKDGFKYQVVEVSGALTNYEVKMHYLPKPMKNPENDFLEEGVNRIIDIMKTGDEGDIIFFVNSENEATQACQNLRNKAKELKPFCIELSGASVRNKEKMNYARNEFKYKNHPNGPFSRKVVIATNAAEASITVKGLVYVIDSGWAFVDSYEPKRMERRLLQERISKAQAIQRTGRVGRTKPGVCYRLYTEKEFKEFRDYPVVDIRKSDLTYELLRFMKLPYVNNIADLLNILKELIEPPGEDFVKSGLYRLYALGAIDKMSGDGKLTELGEKIIKFRKLDPIMARIVIESYKYDDNVKYDIVTIVALLNRADGRMNSFIKDLKTKRDDKSYKTDKAKYERALKKFVSGYGDIFTLLKIYKEFKDHESKHGPDETKKWCNENYLKYDNLKAIKKNIDDIFYETRDIMKQSMNKIEESEYIYDYDKDEPIVTQNKRKGGYKYTGGYKIDEDKIMKILIKGMFISAAKYIGHNKYENCFPFEKTVASLSRDSRLTSEPKFIIYQELANILGRQKYNIVNKMTETAIKNLDNKEKQMISQCFVKSQHGYKSKDRHKDKHKDHKKFIKR